MKWTDGISAWGLALPILSLGAALLLHHYHWGFMWLEVGCQIALLLMAVAYILAVVRVIRGKREWSAVHTISSVIVALITLYAVWDPATCSGTAGRAYVVTCVAGIGLGHLLMMRMWRQRLFLMSLGTCLFWTVQMWLLMVNSGQWNWGMGFWEKWIT